MTADTEIVKRLGRWALEEVEEGMYEITEYGEVRAEIVTHAHEPEDPLEDYSPFAVIYRVRDVADAEEVFHNFVEKESGFMDY